MPCVNKEPQDNITFLGRFAQWIYNSKIQNIIKIGEEYATR